MNQKDRLLEENTARLLQAALGAEVRPGVQVRKQTFQRLLAQMRERSATVPFPDAAVTFLGGILALVAGVLAFQAIANDVPLVSNPLLFLTTVGLIFNLALVPVASIVIVVKRRHHE